MTRWTEEQLQEHFKKKPRTLAQLQKTKDFKMDAAKKRNAQPEEDMKKEFYQLVCFQLPKEEPFLYRRETFAFRNLITKENAGKAMGRTKQLHNSGYKKGEFDYEFTKIAPNFNKLRDFLEYNGLHIEFKVGKNKLTKEQEIFKEQQESDAVKKICVVCYSAHEGIEEIKKYLCGEL